MRQGSVTACNPAPRPWSPDMEIVIIFCTMLDLNSTTYGLLSGMPWFFTELPVLGKCSACIDFLIYMRFSEWCLVVLETLAWKLIPIVLCIRGLRKVLPRDPRHRWGCTRSPTRSTASVGFAQGPPCDPLHRWGGIRSTCGVCTVFGLAPSTCSSGVV